MPETNILQIARVSTTSALHYTLANELRQHNVVRQIKSMFAQFHSTSM